MRTQARRNPATLPKGDDLMGHQTTPGAGPSAALAGNLTDAQMDLVIRHLPVQVSVVDEDGTLVYWHGDLFADCEVRHVGVHVDESHNEHSRRTIARMEAAFRDGSREEAVFRRIEEGRRSSCATRRCATPPAPTAA